MVGFSMPQEPNGDKVAAMMKGLGRRQKSILKWIGRQSGLTSPADLRKRWPPTSEQVYRRGITDTLTAIQGQYSRLPLQALIEQSQPLVDFMATEIDNLAEYLDSYGPVARQALANIAALEQSVPPALRAELLRTRDGAYTETVELDHAPYVSDEYFAPATPSRPAPTTSISWQPTRMLGREPSAGQRASISRALRDLEVRGLVKRYRHSGAPNRTTHVDLSKWGGIASVKLQLQDDDD